MPAPSPPSTIPPKPTRSSTPVPISIPITHQLCILDACRSRHIYSPTKIARATHLPLREVRAVLTHYHQSNRREHTDPRIWADEQVHDTLGRPEKCPRCPTCGAKIAISPCRRCRLVYGEREELAETGLIDDSKIAADVAITGLVKTVTGR